MQKEFERDLSCDENCTVICDQEFFFIFSALNENICTQINFDFPTRTWMDKTASVTNDFERKWSTKRGFLDFLDFFENFLSESLERWALCGIIMRV